MLQSSLYYLHCPNCKNSLDVEIFERSQEIKEGFLFCAKCEKQYPIILNIPILYSNLTSYLASRSQLGGFLINIARNEKIKSFVKHNLKIGNPSSDLIPLEKRWVVTYKNSIKSKFYSHVKNFLTKIPGQELALEHGCSIGYVTKYLSSKNNTVFGIDQSFFAIVEAKKNNYRNLDFFVADSLNHPFGENKFGLILGLNLLELIEPLDLLDVIAAQSNDSILISDPYDFERGSKSVKHKVDSVSLREEIKKRRFHIVHGQKPKFLPWKLNINSRLSLHYKTDLIYARIHKI